MCLTFRPFRFVPLSVTICECPHYLHITEHSLSPHLITASVALRRGSRSGVLNISDSTCELDSPSADQYTPLRDQSAAAAPAAAQGDFTDEEGRACSNV